jgi:hypothetical protein
MVLPAPVLLHNPMCSVSARVVKPTLCKVAPIRLNLGKRQIVPGGLSGGRATSDVEGHVVIMFFGPQPRRMTKWGAFWAYTAPLNVGIFYALLRDAPWNKKVNLVPEPRAGDRFAVDQATGREISRLGGWNMFFWASFLGKFAISLVLFAVMWALPEFVDPIAWTGVDMGGNQLFP